MSHYDILGVNSKASTDEIRKAYKKKALLYHPDRPGGNEKLFREATEAYEILIDEEKRDLYDRGVETNAPKLSTNFDMFRDLFKEMEEDNEENSAFHDHEHKIQRPQDIFFNMEISSQNLYLGCKKRLIVSRKRKCESCFSKNTKPCSECRGRGFKKQLVRKPLLGDVMEKEDCLECLGSGSVFSEQHSSCAVCNGSRLVQEQKMMTIDVDAGCPEGYAIVREGEGNDVTYPGQPTGDLVIKVFAMFPERWTRFSQDLMYESSMSIVSCVCAGNSVCFTHFDGREITVNIPFVLTPQFKDTRNNDWTSCVVDNEGLPFFRELKKTGRLFLVFQIQYPESPIVGPLTNVCTPSNNAKDEKQDKKIVPDARKPTLDEQKEIWKLFSASRSNISETSSKKFTELPKMNDDDFKNNGCAHQ
jgi:DnaJ-class molecular chaperone